MVENYNMSGDVLLLHLPNPINEMAIVLKARFRWCRVVKCCFSHFPSFSHSMLTNGNVSQFHAGKTFLLHNFYVPAHTRFYVQGECYFLRLLQSSSGGRVRSEHR